MDEKGTAPKSFVSISEACDRILSTVLAQIKTIFSFFTKQAKLFLMSKAIAGTTARDSTMGILMPLGCT
jgi:hypothetical protein